MWTVFGWSFNTLSVYETRELISDPTSVCVCVNRFIPDEC